MSDLRHIESMIDKREIKKADVAIARLMRSTTSPEDVENLLILRARTRLLTGRPDDAINDLTSAQASGLEGQKSSAQFLELWGDAHFARFELASVGFADRADTMRAQEAYEQIMTLYPNYSNMGWVHYQLGRICLTQNNIKLAQQYFQSALINASHLRYLTAYCYERLGFIAFYENRDINRSLAFLDRAVNTYPPSEDTRWLVQTNILWSRVYKTSGDVNQALETAERALKLASTSHVEKKSISEAILNITEILSGIQGHDKETLVYLEQFTQQTKRPPGTDVTWSRVYEMRGDAHFALGQYDDAISDYLTALQFNPDHPWELLLHQQIARCYYKMQAYKDTIDSINALFNIARQDGLHIEDYRIYELLGSAYFALKQYDEASQAYQSALEMVPPNAESGQQIRSYYNLAKEMI